MFPKKATYQFAHGLRPIVRIRLENLHDSAAESVLFPAVVDTGASLTVVPAYLCRYLGHSFEDGLSVPSISGIGDGTVRAFAHSTRLTALFPDELNADSPQAFDPFEFSCAFIDQFLPAVLLGQQDFLRMFRYTQDGRAGWFSLEQISASQGNAANIL